eukprot:3525321-Rhodomonas_salina.1
MVQPRVHAPCHSEAERGQVTGQVPKEGSSLEGSGHQIEGDKEEPVGLREPARKDKEQAAWPVERAVKGQREL